MDKSTNVKPSRSRTSGSIGKSKARGDEENKTRSRKHTVDKAISERQIQIGLVESCNHIRIARPPRLNPVRESNTERIYNDDIKSSKIVLEIKHGRNAILEEDSVEDIHESMVADDDTGTDDEDYSIPEYSDSESVTSMEADETKLEKPKTPIYEVERKVSMVFEPVRIEKPSKKDLGPKDELVILRQKKDSASSVTDSNIDITQKDSSCHDQESSGDDQPKHYFRENVKDAKEIETLDENNNEGQNVCNEAASNTSVNTYDIHSDYEDDGTDGCRSSPSREITCTERQYQPGCQFLPPLPWLSRFREKYSRPGWDSSPYNPNCNRPAWDEHLYIEARERFQRHEAVKSRTNGFEFQLFPVAMANYRPNSNYNQPIYDISFRKPSLQQNEIKSSSATRATSKMSSPQFRRQQMAQTPYPEGGTDPSGSVLNEENTRPLPSLDAVGASPAPEKSTISSGAVPQPLQSNKNSQVIDASAKPQIQTTASGAPGLRRTSSSNTPRIVPFHHRDYSPSWRKIAMEERKKAAEAAKEKPKEPEKPKPLNPLPRVALLCKPNHRKSASGCGGYYSPSMKPGVQIFDERGRIKPQWDPSPFVPIGKRNAWDDSVPKCDYYRSKYIGWMM